MSQWKWKTIGIFLSTVMLLNVVACSGNKDIANSSVNSSNDISAESENLESELKSDTVESTVIDESTGAEASSKSTSSKRTGTSSRVIPGANATIPTKAPSYKTQKTSGGTVIPVINTVKGKTITLLCVDYGQFDPNGSANEYLKQYYGATVKMTRVANDNVVPKFTAAVLSDTPFDLVADCDGFPSLVAQDLMQPLDNTIDFNIPEMAKNKEIFDAYVLKGHNYFLPWVRSTRGLIYFNQELFEDENLDIDGDGKKGDTPYTLYQAGKWNMATFKKAAQQMTQKNKKGEVTVYGLLARAWTDSKLVYASGQPIAKWNGKQAVNNLNNSSYQRIYNDYVSLFLNDKVALRGDEFNSYGNFNKGMGAMLLAPSFCVNGDYFADIFKTQNVGIAPFPQDTNASTYYVAGNAIGFYVSQGGMESKGGKQVNVDLINAFINSALASEIDKSTPGTPAYNETRSAFVKKWSAKNKKFTDKWYDDYQKTMKTLESKTTTFVDPYDVCIDLNGDILDPMMGTGDVTPVNFTTAVNKANGKLNAVLDTINK